MCANVLKIQVNTLKSPFGPEAVYLIPIYKVQQTNTFFCAG